MEGVFAEYLPRLVASWNPQCSAINRSIIQQLGQQIVALEEELNCLRKSVRSDIEVKVTLATRDKEIEALRESIGRLERVLIKANQRIIDLEQQNEKLIIQQHSDRQVIKTLSTKLKIKPSELAKEVSSGEWDPNDAALSLEKLSLVKNYEALKRRFTEVNRVHALSVEKLEEANQLALKEKSSDIEELRNRNKELQSRLEQKRVGILDRKVAALENIQKDYAKAVLSRYDHKKAVKSGPKDLHYHELIRIIDKLEREKKDLEAQCEDRKKHVDEEILLLKSQFKQLQKRKRLDEEGLRNHVRLLEDQLKRMMTRLQASKSNSSDTNNDDSN
ncbi:Hypothetical predicted protein [Cloeon dipterum]|uniref:Uncharacterized protein n=1 Tax=Cloeon dipterum TaxID=197152 RepID=A0A8S1D4K7_9INSE|nr:Hypothetical predicted protein [Cloeon dipterum]